ncbi:MAG: hypothetical protein IT285_11215 [Bdellovibrionales bacterium]|nr:hypothetical protein [Bdellovibrionales bacterium]
MAANALYDFDGANDQIQISVTGVVDIRSRGIESIGGISDPNRLYCTATAVVQPFRYPVRYYVSNTGRIYTVHSRGRNRTDNEAVDVSWVFSNLYAQGASRVSNILSVAVHPRNYGIYVLRPGSLARYGNCGGIPMNCSLANDAVGGIADDGLVGTPSYEEWPVNGAIRHIGVDFSSGTVYGVSGDKREFYRIDLGTGTSTTVLAGEFPRPPGGVLLAQRLTGFFIAPGGGEAFVSDLANSQVLGSLNYASTIYRIGDTTLTQPVIVMPLNALSYSN